MNKKISLTTLGIMSTTLIGCSNQVDSIQPLQSQSQQVSAQSNSGLNNAESNFSTLFFEVIDSNKNGYITYTDLSSYLKNQSNELKLVFNKIDKDSDGKINLNDINKSPKLFLSLFNTDKQSLKRMATESFNKIDKDKDGKIIKSDFIDYIGTYFYFTLGLNNQLKKTLIGSFMFESSDKNKDKLLNFSEFEDFIYNLLSSMIQGSMVGSAPIPSPNSKPVPDPTPLESDL